jgi:hypothetical protein
MSPFNAAWNLLKALPEQRVTAASYREGIDSDIGTVHPAIMGMLQRIQGTKNPDLRSVSSLDDDTDGKLIGLAGDYDKRRQAPTRGVYRPRYDPDSKMIDEFTDYPYAGEPRTRPFQGNANVPVSHLLQAGE